MIMADNKQNTNPNVPNSGNAPKLRFPEFSEDWSYVSLESLAPNISAGKDSSEDGKYNLYGSTGIIGKTKTSTYKGEIVLVARVGANAGLLQYVNDEFGVTDNTLVVNAHENNKYIYYYLQFYNLNRLVFGSGQPLITGGMLKKIPIGISIGSSEKNKVVELLSLIDERIGTQNKIIQQLQSLIKGIYDKVFEDISDYQKLSSVCTIQKGQQVNGKELSELGDYYVMNGGIEPSGYYDRYNTYANTISISEGGNSCGYVQYNNVPFWSGGHCYTLQNIKEGYHNLFLYHYLKAREKEIMALRIGSGLPNIQKKDLEKFFVPILPLETQVGIVDGINKIETKLKQEKDILSAYQKQKAYLLRNLFI